MAQHVNIMMVPNSIEEAFAYVGDLKNAAEWDPSVRKVEQHSDSLGAGTTFDLWPWLSPWPLPYEIKIYEPPHRILLMGETRAFRYYDDIVFDSLPGETMITYTAYLSPTSRILLLGSPIVQSVFGLIAEKVTENIEVRLRRRYAEQASPSTSP